MEKDQAPAIYIKPRGYFELTEEQQQQFAEELAAQILNKTKEGIEGETDADEPRS